MKSIIKLFLIGCLIVSCSQSEGKDKTNSEQNKSGGQKMFEVNKSDSEWKAELSPDSYRVLREKGTELPFTGKYYLNNDKGIYKCAACGNELFQSETKFDAGCGWPSFYQGIDKGRIIEKIDSSHGMIRTEIICAKCGSHLGHVFDDGPKPTGLRYCVNSASLDFSKDTTK